MDINLASLEGALKNFTQLVNADLQALSTIIAPFLIDGLKNGQAQKFEYTLELCWKTIKVFLKEQEGIDEVSPKKVIKAFYLGGYLAEDDYLCLLQAVDDRNKLSHIYDQADFDLIVSRLPEYARVLQIILQRLQTERI